MPLLDHFHAPLSEERHWGSFFLMWAREVMTFLHLEGLQERFFAEVFHYGEGSEVGGCTAEKLASPSSSKYCTEADVVVVEAPPTTFTMSSVFPDAMEVLVFQTSGGPNLVGAILFVCPGNKDRPQTRRAFATKCANYLHQVNGLIIVDVVTDKKANMHDELIDLLGLPDTLRFPGASPIYCAAYRPYSTEPARDQIDVCCAPLAVAKPLPRMPLSLRRGPTVMIDLEATYMEARLCSRL